MGRAGRAESTTHRLSGCRCAKRLSDVLWRRNRTTRLTSVTRQHHGTTPAPQTWDHLGACHYQSMTMIPSL